MMPFLLLPYLTRRLGVEGFGELSFYLAIIAIIFLFVGLSLDGAIARYYYRYGKRALGYIISTAYIYALFTAVLFGVLGVVMGYSFAPYLSAAGLVQSMLNIQLAIRQCQKKSIDYIKLQLGYSILSVLITVGIFELYLSSPEGRVIALVLSGLMAAIISSLIFLKNYDLKLQRFLRLVYLHGRYILAFGLPLIFHQANGFLKGQADRLFIYNYFDAHSLGVYASSFQVASILGVLILAVNKAVVPYYYESLKNHSLSVLKINKIFRLSLLTVPVPAILSLLVPDSLFVYVLGGEFSGVSDYLFPFLLGIGFNIPYLVLVNYLFYYGENTRIAKVTFSSALFYIGLVVFFSRFGLVYIAYALLVSNIAMLLLLYISFVQVSGKKNSLCKC